MCVVELRLLRRGCASQFAFLSDMRLIRRHALVLFFGRLREGHLIEGKPLYWKFVSCPSRVQYGAGNRVLPFGVWYGIGIYLLAFPREARYQARDVSTVLVPFPRTPVKPRLHSRGYRWYYSCTNIHMWVAGVGISQNYFDDPLSLMTHYFLRLSLLSAVSTQNSRSLQSSP